MPQPLQLPGDNPGWGPETAGPGGRTTPGWNVPGMPQPPAGCVWRAWTATNPHDQDYFWVWIDPQPPPGPNNTVPSSLPLPPRGQYWTHTDTSNGGALVWYTLNAIPYNKAGVSEGIPWAAPSTSHWVDVPGSGPVLQWDGAPPPNGDGGKLPQFLYPYSGPAGVYSSAAAGVASLPIGDELGQYWTSQGSTWFTTKAGFGAEILSFIVVPVMTAGLAGGGSLSDTLQGAAEGQDYLAHPDKAVEDMAAIDIVAAAAAVLPAAIVPAIAAAGGLVTTAAQPEASTSSGSAPSSPPAADSGTSPPASASSFAAMLLGWLSARK